MAKKIPYYSNDRKLFPMTKTEYVKRGGRWFPVSREREMISRKQAGYVLDKHGLPFERSHRLEKRDRYRHNEPYDTFSSISPDGQKKIGMVRRLEYGSRKLSAGGTAQLCGKVGLATP